MDEEKKSVDYTNMVHTTPRKPNSFIVSDDIEIGSGNKIPLYLFGFLY
jgi:hypothetical protein